MYAVSVARLRCRCCVATACFGLRACVVTTRPFIFAWGVELGIHVVMERLKCVIAIQFVVPCLLLLFNSHDFFRDAVAKRGKAPVLLQFDGGRYWVRTSDPWRVKVAYATGEARA